MDFQLMISDYDGTLGKAPANNIEEQTLNAINEFTSKGGKFAICTGRAYTSISKICLSHGLTGPVVCFQGAQVYDISTGKVLFDGGLDVNTAIEVLRKFYSLNLQVLVYIEGSFYYSVGSEYVKYYEQMVGIKGIYCDDLEKTILTKNKNVNKICALCQADKMDYYEKLLNAEYKGERVVFNSGAKHLLEAINPKTDKGFAVKFLADYFGIPLEKVITVGDSTNDKSLLVGDWHGVAVGDGHEQLKMVAKEVTVPFDQKPIKTLLEKYCL